ncbi:MAG: RNA polymerase sigma factor [Candidatus Dojkabacteria bacterium]
MTDLHKEKELLQRAQENNKYFDELYEYLVPHVYRFAYTLTGNRYDAEDVTSSSFTEFYRIFKTFEWRGISLRYWLFRTARNFAYRNKSHIMMSQEEINELPDEPEITFVDEIINKDMVNKVKEAILTLKQPEQELIALRIWEGMEFHDIADILGDKPATVRKRFYRCIDKVRKKLEEQNMYSAFPYPVLFSAIAKSGKSKEFLVPDTISKYSPIMTGTLTTIKTFLTSNFGIAMIAGLVVLTGASIGTWVYIETKNQNETVNEQTSLADVQGNVEQTRNDNENKVYTNEEFGFQFEYPAQLRIELQKGDENGPNDEKLLISMFDKDGTNHGSLKIYDKNSLPLIEASNTQNSDTELFQIIKYSAKGYCDETSSLTLEPVSYNKNTWIHGNGISQCESGDYYYHMYGQLFQDKYYTVWNSGSETSTELNVAMNVVLTSFEPIADFTTSTITQTIPATDDTYAGWKTYTSEQVGVSFRYPDGIAHIKESITNLGPGPLSGQKTFMITIQEKAPTGVLTYHMNMRIYTISKFTETIDQINESISSPGAQQENTTLQTLTIEEKKYSVEKYTYSDGAPEGNEDCLNVSGADMYLITIPGKVAVALSEPFTFLQCDPTGSTIKDKKSVPQEDFDRAVKIVESIKVL